ncbi:hypothetical protein ACAW87_10125 [Fibrella sp. GW2-5]
MKKLILSLSVLLATCSVGFSESEFVVSRNFSKREIKRIERKMIKEFGVKVQLKVISRDDKKEITNLEFIRYKADGSMSSSCSSDKFGKLIVSSTGCQIADLGHENKMVPFNK